MSSRPSDFARAALRAQVTRLFNDASKGERPVTRRADALFAPNSVAWRVHGDVVTMLIGGVASLMLQMLHPSVLAGVWDHSDFRNDMMARLRATAKFIARTTYDHAEEGQALIARVRRIHDHVHGTLPDGTPYQANDPRLLAWVHVTEAISFLDAWIAYGEPRMSRRDQDRYFEEVAVIGRALGADPVPMTRAEAEALIAAMRPELAVDHRTREVAGLVLDQTVGPAIATVPSKVLMQAAVDLLPDWARAMHGLKTSGLSRPAVREGAWVLARTLRWAFDGSPNRRVLPPGQFMDR
ncbi:MAG TPA: oxygenase MpaB family protein [Brevundimonas sp.]|uniref:oxygenase MpaB family protein n=1 Tax=Brevundimonas sp. TaxID=1871086 RepID=UPI002BC0F405|nr:oxygenase MpaB family protein [Brevundimonas sp.]HRH20593.1 oxygenase MpaB family protein [Brevundimonas sp.]